ncbi:hypothetical protein [Sphingobacterium kyonggiense]
MKAKLLILCMPVLLLITVVSCQEGLLDLIEGEVEERAVVGTWEAYEYYSNEIGEDEITGKDFKKINQIGKVNYETREIPCTTKISKYEQLMSLFQLNLKSGGNGEYTIKGYQKFEGWDYNCTAKNLTESLDETDDVKWKIIGKNAQIAIFEHEEDEDEGTFDIVKLTSNEMHLKIDRDDDYMLIKLRKK